MDTIRLQIRERLGSGALPRDPAQSTAAGMASGTHRCAACDTLISGIIEFRLRFPDGRTLRFHARCRDAWQAERAAFET
jgi:hypothetical protein